MNPMLLKSGGEESNTLLCITAVEDAFFKKIYRKRKSKFIGKNV